MADLDGPLNSQMNTEIGSMKLFVYGTLLFDEVLQKVIGRVPQKTAVVLKGYKRYGIIGRCYPAIIPSPDSIIEGMLISIAINEASLIDEYEGPEYTHSQVTVTHTNTATDELVSVYIWTYPLDQLVGEWHPNEFATNHLNNFLETF